MPCHRQPRSLLALCHSQVSHDLVSTCRLLQISAQESSASQALATARRRFRPLYVGSLPGPIRALLIEEVSRVFSAPSPDGSAAGAGPAPLYLLALLLAQDVRRLRVELCCYYGCSHQVALLRLLASEGQGLETLELSRSALLRLDRSLLHGALVSATSLKHLTLRNIAGDTVLQVIGSSCPNLTLLDVSHSRQVTDAGLKHLFLQVELRDKPPTETAKGSVLGGSGGNKGWGRLKILLRLFPWLNRDANRGKDRSFLLEYCEMHNPLCGSLRVLNVANTGITSVGVLLALHHCTVLQTLGDYGHMGRALDILDRAWAAGGLRIGLTQTSFSLTSARSQRTTTRRMQLLAAAFPALQRLTVLDPHHPPAALQLFPATLTSLHLLSVPVSADWLTGLYDYLASPQGRALAELTLRFAAGDVRATVDLARVIGPCTSLQTLCQDGADISWGDADTPLLPALRSVQLGRSVSAQALTHLLRAAPALEIAHFYSCPDLEDHHVVSLVGCLASSLQCLYIYETPHVTMTAVVALLDSCDNLLQTGNLANWGLTCEGVQAIHSTLLTNNLDFEIISGAHWFCSQCFPVS